MTGVNLNAHFWTLKAFLPAMLKAEKGHIVSQSPRLMEVDLCANSTPDDGTLQVSITSVMGHLGVAQMSESKIATLDFSRFRANTNTGISFFLTFPF